MKYLPDDGGVWVLTPGRDGKWEADGVHGHDTDLTETFRILNQISAPATILKLTISADGWPTIEDVTAEAKGTGRVRCIMPSCVRNTAHMPGDGCVLSGTVRGDNV